MLTYKIHLIRHGLTQGNLEGRFVGSTDMPLCEEGRNQLLELSQQYDYPGVAKVYTSPMLRARESAELLFPEHTPIVLDALRECHLGDFENRTMQDLEQDPLFKEWIATPLHSACPPNGESGLALQERIQEGIAHIFGQMMEQRTTSVAVVTHGGVIMALLASMGLPQRDMVHWSVQNGRGYTILLTTQMWMRDHKFEVYSTLPFEKIESNDE